MFLNNSEAWIFGKIDAFGVNEKQRKPTEFIIYTETVIYTKYIFPSLYQQKNFRN